MAKTKLIIDTDPGIDDAMAILMAFHSPEVEIIGLTTIFGNVPTSLATHNALHLLEVIGREDVPVAQGCTMSLKNVPKVRIADFVHGKDGLGNTNPSPPKRKALDLSAKEFLLKMINTFPGEVTVVALGPLTNIAMAIRADPMFAKNVKQIVVLGGAFFVNGNVNPASEANILGDPEAADIVFTSGADILVVGINITHQVVMTDDHLKQLGQSESAFAKYVYEISHFYFDYHHEAYDMKGVYLHDPTALAAAVDPLLFTFAEGVVRVQVDGISKGMTIFNNTGKRWGEVTEWCNKPSVKVAVTVDANQITDMLMERLLTDVK
ncbi:hypothetical protein GOP47_0006292 [Adiantum capillus-veneris]|uniref:uridine nucleosidase n=1 Tax=Adiantum capillus-veneris TaxID=13818 RepID=A0A9D4V3A7_ADICA|nr:hypothetical protein GOP47_0006292 [Adiantum capillus-veneris]